MPKHFFGCEDQSGTSACFADVLEEGRRDQTHGQGGIGDPKVVGSLGKGSLKEANRFGMPLQAEHGGDLTKKTLKQAGGRGQSRRGSGKRVEGTAECGEVFRGCGLPLGEREKREKVHRTVFSEGLEIVPAEPVHGGVTVGIGEPMGVEVESFHAGLPTRSGGGAGRGVGCGIQTNLFKDRIEKATVCSDAVPEKTQHDKEKAGGHEEGEKGKCDHTAAVIEESVQGVIEATEKSAQDGEAAEESEGFKAFVADVDANHVRPALKDILANGSDEAGITQFTAGFDGDLLDDRPVFA